MAAKELVVKVDGLWFRAAWHPEAVAQELEVADVPAKRQARHQQDGSRTGSGVCGCLSGTDCGSTAWTSMARHSTCFR